MESCDNQYSNSRNNYLYIHSINRSVWNNSNDDHCREYCVQHRRSHRSDHLCQNSTAPALPRLHPQWRYRYMEPCNHQYRNSRNHYLYIHSSNRSVRNNSNDDHCGQSCATPTFTQIGPLCQKQHCTCITQQHPIMDHWYMESCNNQYGNSRNHDLYIHSINRSMWNNRNDDHCGECCSNTDIHTDRTTLPEQYCTCIAHFINNGVTGTWSPATINTATAGTTTYTFTPATGQCGTTATMSIVVNAAANANVHTDWSFVSEFNSTCITDYIKQWNTGTWSPATINTATAGTTTYTFTPATGQCGTTATMSYCCQCCSNTNVHPDRSTVSEHTAPALPTSSNNGITGTWSPATINTSTVGTTTYTFTPITGQCGTTATMNIVINAELTPTFTQIGPLCQNIPHLLCRHHPTMDHRYLESCNHQYSNSRNHNLYIYSSTGQCGTTATMNIVVNLQ